MAIPPLAGFTVAVTADRRAEEQVMLLQRRGASVVVGAAVRTLPIADSAGLWHAIDRLIESPPEVTVLLTGIGTRGLVGAAEAVGRDAELVDALTGSFVVARGPKAAGAATTAGLDVGWQTPGERSSEIVVRLASHAERGARIAVQRDGQHEPLLARELASLGADVIDVPVYRWELPEDLRPAKRVIEAVIARQVDAVTFTSSPAMQNVLALADEEGSRAALLDAFRSDVAAVCVGPVCAETAASAGIEGVVTPMRARLGAMVQALVVHMAGRSETFALGDSRVTVQGSAVFVDDRLTSVGGREHALLLALARSGGAVVSKPKLLRAVWGEGYDDEHAVEVAVARLRQRLGAAGRGVRTVPRRGYRLTTAL